MAMEILKTWNKIINVTKKLRSSAKTILPVRLVRKKSGYSVTAEELYLPLLRSQSQRDPAKMKLLVKPFFKLNIIDQLF